MTLIVGIKCSDGVVLGADGAATLGTLGNRTVRQTAQKLAIISDRVIVGVSGPVGLGQRIRAEIETLWADGRFSGLRPDEAGAAIRTALFDKTWGPELKAAGVARNAIGQGALDSALSTTLVALPVKKEPTLILFDQQGAPELATQRDVPFMAVGSGQAIADPFLAFLRRIFWPDRLPNLQEGVLTAVWTLDQAIKTHPGGVADPVQVVTLCQEGKECCTRELTEEDLAEHRVAIKSAELAMAGYLQKLHAPPEAGEVPPPPKT